jgi:hypothetical protein
MKQFSADATIDVGKALKRNIFAATALYRNKTAVRVCQKLALDNNPSRLQYGHRCEKRDNTSMTM